MRYTSFECGYTIYYLLIRINLKHTGKYQGLLLLWQRENCYIIKEQNKKTCR